MTAPSIFYRARRAAILLGLGLGPGVFLAGSWGAGRWPQGLEWLETVILVPVLSLLAGGAAAGLFLVLGRLTGWGPRADTDDPAAVPGDAPALDTDPGRG